MTVSKEYNKHIYEGNGLTRDWPYDFDLPITAAGTPDTSLIHVFRTNLRGEVTEVTAFSVDAETGTLTYPTSGSPLETGEKLTILRLLDVRQQFFDPSNQANLYPETLEDNTDRLVMMVQQLQEETDRAVKVGLSTDLETEDITAEGIFEARDIALSAAETAEGYANMLPAIADELDVNIVVDEADLRAKLAAIGASNASLVIATTIPIAADLAIPSNVALSFKKTGQLQPAVGTTLTINGPIEAGLWQIFDGDGTVAGNPKIEAVYPEWFGAKRDGVTDDRLSIQKAIDWAVLGCRVVKFQMHSNNRDFYLVSSINESGDCALKIPSTAYSFTLKAEGKTWAPHIGDMRDGEVAPSATGIMSRGASPETWVASFIKICTEDAVTKGVSTWMNGFRMENISISSYKCGAIFYAPYLINSEFNHCSFSGSYPPYSGIEDDVNFAFVGIALQGWQNQFNNVFTRARVGFLIGARNSISVTCTNFNSCYASRITKAGYILNKAVYSSFNSCAADGHAYGQINGAYPMSGVKDLCGDNDITSFIQENAITPLNVTVGYYVYQSSMIGLNACGSEATGTAVAANGCMEIIINQLLHGNGGSVEAIKPYSIWLEGCGGRVEGVYSSTNTNIAGTGVSSHFRPQKYSFSSYGSIGHKMLSIYGISRKDITCQNQAAYVLGIYVAASDSPIHTRTKIAGVSGATKLILPVRNEPYTNMIYYFKVSGMCRNPNPSPPVNSAGYGMFEAEILFRNSYGDSGSIGNILEKHLLNITSVTASGTGDNRKLILTLNSGLNASNGMMVQVDDWRRADCVYNGSVYTHPPFFLEDAYLEV